MVVALVSSAGADGLEIEVSLDQQATVIGRGHSLKQAVTELCWQANVELRFYDAEDREFRVTYSERPLDEVLARLLNRESFVVGVRASASGPRPRLVWLGVLGPNEVAMRSRAERAWMGAVRPFRLPPRLITAAFASKDEGERQRALAKVAEHVSGDPRQRAGFLGTDAKLIAQSLVRYARAGELLEGLLNAQQDPELRTKLTKVIAALHDLRE